MLQLTAWIKISLDECLSSDDDNTDKVLSKWLKEVIAQKSFDDVASLIEYLEEVSEQDGVSLLEIVSANRMVFRYILENFADLNFANDRKNEQNKKIVCLKDYREEQNKCRM